MNELSLFSGAGGGLLATKHLLGWRTIGYVEWDDYCQRVLAQRIKDGLLDEAPIFSDIRAFISEGYAERYRGMVDILTAGFPCQPFSVAGKQKGEQDERNMWPQTIECIRIIRPRYAFLENVPGLLANEYIRRIYGDLAEAGYDAQWCVLGADDCGANHRRKRLWILAYTDSFRSYNPILRIINKDTPKKPPRKEELGELVKTSDVAEPTSTRRTPRSSKGEFRGCGEVADSMPEYSKESITRDKLSETSGQISIRGESMGTGGGWATEPRLGRVAHGVAHRVDRLKAIGNGQVPAVVRAIWRLLNAE